MPGEGAAEGTGVRVPDPHLPEGECFPGARRVGAAGGSPLVSSRNDLNAPNDYQVKVGESHPNR